MLAEKQIVEDFGHVASPKGSVRLRELLRLVCQEAAKTQSGWHFCCRNLHLHLHMVISIVTIVSVDDSIELNTRTKIGLEVRMTDFGKEANMHI